MAGSISAATVALLTGKKGRSFAAWWRLSLVSVSFGNGTLTYPNGGIPLPYGPKGTGDLSIYGIYGQGGGIYGSVIVVHSIDGYVYYFDFVNMVIRIFEMTTVPSSGGLAAGPLSEVSTSFAPAATSMTLLIIGG